MSEPQIIASSTGTESGVTLLASEDGLVAPLSGSECVFQLRRSGENHVMTYQVLKAMDACRQFRTMDEHVQVVAKTMPELQQHPEAIRKVLENLVSRNLLTTADEFVRETFSGGAGQESSSPVGIFVRTKDRPEQLRRLLASGLELEHRFGRARRYFIVDDSRDEALAQQNKAVTLEFDGQTGAGASYLGASWRAALCGALIESFPQEESQISWLLGPALDGDGFTGGQAWNAVLLATAGRRFLMFDDDFALSARKPHGADLKSLDLMPDASSRHVSFYDSHDAVLQAGEQVGVDPLLEHERLCGAPLAGMLDHCDYALAVESLKNREIKSLRRHLSGARIKTTHMGIYGHSGAGGNAWIYLIPAGQRAQLWRSEQAYRALMAEEWVMHGITRAKLSTLGVYAPVAVDNCTLAPFTAPKERGEDFHFASTLKLMYPNSVDFEVPWMMGHFRPTGSVVQKPAALTPPLSRFISDFAGNIGDECRALDPRKRYEYLAASLRDQAAAPNLERQRILREYLSYARARLIEQLNRTLVQAEGAPDYWTADLKTLVETNGTALLNAGAPKLRGWHRQNTARACADQLTSELQQHASAMDLWPAMWEFCRQDDGHWLGG